MKREIIQFSPYVQIRHELGRLYRVWLVIGNQGWCVTPEPYENHEFDQAEAIAKHLSQALYLVMQTAEKDNAYRALNNIANVSVQKDVTA